MPRSCIISFLQKGKLNALRRRELVSLTAIEYKTLPLVVFGMHTSLGFAEDAQEMLKKMPSLLAKIKTGPLKDQPYTSLREVLAYQGKTIPLPVCCKSSHIQKVLSMPCNMEYSEMTLHSFVSLKG